MNYDIEAVGTIELRRPIGAVDYELSTELDLRTPVSFKDIVDV